MSLTAPPDGSFVVFVLTRRGDQIGRNMLLAVIIKEHLFRVVLYIYIYISILKD